MPPINYIKIIHFDGPMRGQKDQTRQMPYAIVRQFCFTHAFQKPFLIMLHPLLLILQLILLVLSFLLYFLSMSTSNLSLIAPLSVVCLSYTSPWSSYSLRNVLQPLSHSHINSFEGLSSLQRINTENSKQMLPEKELRGHSPNFHIHVSVSDLYISMMDLPIVLKENRWTDPGNTVYKSLTDTWMWKSGLMPRNSQKRNT